VSLPVTNGCVMPVLLLSDDLIGKAQIMSAVLTRAARCPDARH